MKTTCDRIPNSTPAWLAACCGLLLLPLAPSHGHEAPSDAGCASYDVDVANELALLGGSQTALTAVASGAGEAPLLQPGEPYRLRLTPQVDVDFAAPPERRMLDEGAFAGIAAFRVDAPGTWRIGLGHNSWVDVVAPGGALVESTRFGGRAECQALRKMVEFRLEPGVAYTLQLSGGTDAEIGVLITGPIVSDP